MSTDTATIRRDIYTISRLNREVRALLEGSLPLIWIEGEISNLTRHASGHWYFSLKDEIAQVRCAMFRNRNMNVGFKPANGMQVLIRARISLYEARGEFQIIAEHMEEAGDGALRRAYEILKQRLHSEGLFNPEHKQSLPALPRCVGIITSPTGAAIHDILSTLQRRSPLLPVIIYPVLVQGTHSAAQIAAMIRTVDLRNECDVLIIARGGGSLEDLWSFNDEQVARAIHACSIPVVTGIGHEVDFTIADFVADQRAPTPTAAAELISPNQIEIFTRLQQIRTRLVQYLQTRLTQSQRQVEWLTQRSPQPRRQLQNWMQRVDEIQLRQQTVMRFTLRQHTSHLQQFIQRLHSVSPKQMLVQHQQRLGYQTERLRRGITQQLAYQQQRLINLAHALDTISPLATLQRGYAIATRTDNNRLILDATKIQQNTLVDIRLARGKLHCRVETTTPDN